MPRLLAAECGKRNRRKSDHPATAEVFMALPVYQPGVAWQTRPDADIPRFDRTPAAAPASAGACPEQAHDTTMASLICMVDGTASALLVSESWCLPSWCCCSLPDACHDQSPAVDLPPTNRSRFSISSVSKPIDRSLSLVDLTGRRHLLQFLDSKPADAARADFSDAHFHSGADRRWRGLKARCSPEGAKAWAHADRPVAGVPGPGA